MDDKGGVMAHDLAIKEGSIIKVSQCWMVSTISMNMQSIARSTYSLNKRSVADMRRASTCRR